MGKGGGGSIAVFAGRMFGNKGELSDGEQFIVRSIEWTLSRKYVDTTHIYTAPGDARR